MEKFDVKKLTKNEIGQIEILRKFDGSCVTCVHFFVDGDASIDFVDSGSEFTLCLTFVSDYVRKWIKSVWLPNFTRSVNVIHVFDHIERDDLKGIDIKTNYQIVKDAHDFVDFLVNDYIEK